ncbi:hypothetical protein TTHERM_00158120 (macronuclear) [Tetrahymena thermophila SB210]|uniref:Uncharacterized protein n=1 Tax=Tetrahymena thermophila (strain SB210) TaxID=312017 RepID=Q22WC2_TETTS|nr:hypothetical protein TTHERM_00158120 [Tetrahymena thermophila SB210]EAR89495.2 hypothetical protein TTHERM_00158120 [Tetrahymena thermophila SB210]|eukprot:XP_001009740.2 hypothetical protein TTHERM_00158120 [Tetrahymena thermophila SB210]
MARNGNEVEKKQIDQSELIEHSFSKNKIPTYDRHETAKEDEYNCRKKKEQQNKNNMFHTFNNYNNKKLKSHEHHIEVDRNEQDTEKGEDTYMKRKQKQVITQEQLNKLQQFFEKYSQQWKLGELIKCNSQ